MTRREQLQEQYEEALFALLMDEWAAAEGERALRENAALMADPEKAIPESTMRRCKRTIRRQFSSQTARSVGRITGRILNRVAVVALVGTVLFTAAFAASPEFRIKALNLVIDTFDDRTRFSITPDNSPPVQSVITNWLPADYELAREESDRIRIENLYQTPDGKEIELTVASMAGGTHAVDTEDAKLGTVMIHGYEAVTIFKMRRDGYGNLHGHSSVVWVDTERGWFIDISSYQEHAETLVRVAENLILE